MKVLYDYQIFHYQQFGGISRYYANLLPALNSTGEVTITLPLRWSANKEIAHVQPFFGHVDRTLPISQRFRFRGAKRIEKLFYSLFPSQDRERMQQILITHALESGTADIFHPTYFEDYYFSHIHNTPYVLTVYDMIHELFTSSLPLGERGILEKKKRVALHAKKIIAISESTKKDLCRIYGLDPRSVVVIPLANTLARASGKEQTPFSIPLPDDYLLFVGARSGYKNYSFFLQSAAPIFHQRPSLHLICTGPKFSNEEIHLHDKLGLSHKIHFVEAISDDTLIHLYSHAKTLVFPSLYEGFGLPILEAMYCGCPVIVSRTSSFPEVAGDAALYIDPSRMNSIRTIINQLLMSEDLQRELREKGIEREKCFSWQTVAKQTLDVYKSVV